VTGSIQRELIALSDRWRARAKTFMSEAERARRGADMVRLTAMASTLEWAASDLLCRLDVPRAGAVLLPMEGSEDES
jgi:hypothetical protein